MNLFYSSNSITPLLNRLKKADLQTIVK